MKKIILILLLAAICTCTASFAGGDGADPNQPEGNIGRKADISNYNDLKERKHPKKKKGKKVSALDQDPDGENVILYLDRKESASEDTEGD